MQNTSYPTQQNNYPYVATDNQNVADNSAPYTNMQYMQYSSKPLQNDPLGHLQNGLQGQARKKFIIKVYAILTIQLALTVGMCFLSYFCRPFLEFQYSNQWIMWLLFVFMIAVQLVIILLPIGRKHPFNLLLLFVFTLCQGYVISFVCSLVAIENGSQVVVVAAVFTLAVVFCLTVFTMLAPPDIRILWVILVVIASSMLTLGIFSIFAWSPFLYNLYCALGVIVFGIYIIFDTMLITGQLKFGNRLFAISLDDYVTAALILYMDIIQMFLYLLALLSRK